MKTAEQKAAKKAREKARKAEAFARNNVVRSPAIEFAPPESWASVLAEKPKSLARLYAEKHGQWIDED